MNFELLSMTGNSDLFVKECLKNDEYCLITQDDVHLSKIKERNSLVK